ncbi:MAG: hypothetical protein IKS74_00570 [Methanomicrobium sp.]|nr:hypothetical protein [Methanomicrobium sp.]
MKQLLLIISMLLLTIDVSAGDISREQAREIASQLLKEKSVERMLSPAPAEKYILEIDGKVVDDSEIANIPSGDVVSIDAVPAQNGQPKKIVITTKKKK